MLEPVPFQSGPLFGSTVAVMLAALGLFALLALPALRAPALVLALLRWFRRARLFSTRAGDHEPTRPLRLSGLSPTLTRLVRQTRTTALELRRCSAESGQWPDDAAPQVAVRSGWRESLLGTTGVRSPLRELRSEVFEWLRLAETLPVGEREAVAELGVDVEAVRRALTDDGAKRPAREVVSALAGLLWAIDERLAGASAGSYRASGAEHAVVAAPARPGLTVVPDESDDRARRERWAEAIADHGRGISRIAGSYARNGADREDLEQDIALALWRALPGFRGESSLRTFAYRVARYCCFRHVRRRRDPEDGADPQTLPDPAACIESAILGADQRQRIERALGDLPGSLESVLTLHLTGHSYAQIAATLGISERNVSVRLTRARARLRRQLVAA